MYHPHHDVPLNPDLDKKGVSEALELPPSQPEKKRWVSRVLRPGAVLLALSVWGTLQFSRGSLNLKEHVHVNPHSQSSSGEDTFTWDSITPSKNLIYHPCFEDYQCARLEVPMNWNRTDGQGATVAVAIVRLPAKVPITDPRYGGPVLLNPGGPGGSGVSMGLGRGKMIRDIVDFAESPDSAAAQSPGVKYFDIIGFDPRGINNTTPKFTCFETEEERRVWKLHEEAEGNIASSDVAFDTLWARNQAFAQACTHPRLNASDHSEWLGNFINTPQVVADMVEFVERHGEWREEETNRLLGTSCAHRPRSERQKIHLRNSWRRGQEQLLYWGFSYGTALGATFAALQPERVHRVVIDGVVDSDDYYAGTWLANLQDADRALGSFFEYCFEAGLESCPFASDTLEDISTRFQAVLSGLKDSPIAVPPSKTRGPEIITYSDIHKFIMASLYSPMDIFPPVAQMLADLSQGNGTSAADFKADVRKKSYKDGNIREAQAAILCSDGEDMRGMSKSEYRKYWETLENQSLFLGDEWPVIRLPCSSWDARPAHPFDGSFVQNTSHPLLLIGNTLDPVTPIRNAFKMARGFSGARVLHQNSVGHCSIASKSNCTHDAVRTYFQTGELPATGTVCEVNERPFNLPGIKE